MSVYDELVWPADIETTGLLSMLKEQGDEAKLHCLVAKNDDTNVIRKLKSKEKIDAFLSEDRLFAIHNGIGYDEPALRMLGFNFPKLRIIDTLALSWYLEPDRNTHGLAGYGKDFGRPKPEIDNWETQTEAEYVFRCTEDVAIQCSLWTYQRKRLEDIYGKEGWWPLVSLLNWKMELQKQQAANKWLLDIPALTELEEELNEDCQKRKFLLETVMPKIEQFAVKSRPKKPFNQDGRLSAIGRKWKDLCDAHNHPFDSSEGIIVSTGFDDPNANSHTQIKSWLEELGWIPETFKTVREEDGSTRKIPQVNVKGRDDEDLEKYGTLCLSVHKLIDKHPQVKNLDGYGKISHRLSVVRGMLKAADSNGEVEAGCAGFTNTLRLKHRVLVNIPSIRVEYGKEIRSCLLARRGKRLIGSDLSSLEDRIKHHFQWPLDPEYVKSQMSEDFDPHINVCFMGGLMTAAQVADFKSGNKKPYSILRSQGKSTNYACQYGAGITTVARSAGCSLDQGKLLHEGYWKANWSIKAIAESTTVKTDSTGQKWQFNPISKLWYPLRADKDRFSTLVQGTGAYVFDLWIKKIDKLCIEAGLPMVLLGQFHDEIILEIEDDNAVFEAYESIIKEAIKQVSVSLKLNRELDCDVQFGYKYSEIH